MSDYDADLSVYRSSYKGQVQQVMHDLVLLQPLQFSVFYGNRQVLEYQAPGYSYPPDEGAGQTYCSDAAGGLTTD